MARGLLKGCQQHWKESVSRISRNHHIVSPEKETEFHDLITQMYGARTIQAFEDSRERIRAAFPHTSDWLNWWSRIEHASILFPVLRQNYSDFKHVSGFTTFRLENKSLL